MQDEHEARLPPFSPPPSSSTIQFQMPQFALGVTPNLAHGGGAEVLPGMYGQGAQAWNDYDKYWYDRDHPAPSKYYSLSDLVSEPPSLSATSHKPPQTPRPFEFIDSPQHGGPDEGRSTASMEPDEEHEPDARCAPDVRFLPPAPSNVPARSQPNPFSQYSALAMSGFSFPALNTLDPTASLPPIPTNGLPLYSASGFDMLKMFAKVATRPNPKIVVGPVDMTCSFVVVDVRRFDSPIVYASPTFCRLTGYPEDEVLGRNCRFLQAPSGHVERGEERRYTAPDAVRHLQKCLLQEKECQASLINYRKDGGAFINLVTVIPISTDDSSDEITHQIGFQVDLSEQPNAILHKLRDGSYVVNYSTSASNSALPYSREGRRGRGVSQDMLDLLRTLKPWSQGAESAPKPARDSERVELHNLLLENTDDFIHVVSLKGALLYVAPSIQRVLAYDAAELVGKSIADLCHPADVVPLMRELKEASSILPAASPPGGDDNLLFAPQPPTVSPKPVNLLFRARHKTRGYVWLESRGRLHVEQGKGRKAVVLVGRRTEVPTLRWGAIALDERAHVDCWGLVAPNGLVLSASGACAQRLGYGDDGKELVGRNLASLVKPEEGRRVGEVLAGAACADRGEMRRVACQLLLMRTEPVRTIGAEIIFYAHEREETHTAPAPRSPSLPCSLVFRIRFLDASEAVAPEHGALRSETLRSALADAASRHTLPASTSTDKQPEQREQRAPDANVLEELETTRDTSWQYEFTRLRFENQRMRDEVGRLERLRRTQNQMPYLRRHLTGPPEPFMASLGLTLPPPAQKRLRDGGLKLPPPT